MFFLNNKESILYKVFKRSFLFIILPTIIISISIYSNGINKVYESLQQEKKTSITQIAANQKANIDAIKAHADKLTNSSSVNMLLSKKNSSNFPLWSISYINTSTRTLSYSVNYQDLGIKKASVFCDCSDIRENETYYDWTRLKDQKFYQEFLNNKKNYALYILDTEDTQLYFKCMDRSTSKNNSIVLYVQSILDYTDDEQVLGVLVLELGMEEIFAPVFDANKQNNNYHLVLNKKAFLGETDRITSLIDSAYHFKDEGIIKDDDKIFFLSNIEDYDLMVVDSDFIDYKEYWYSASLNSILIVLSVGVLLTVFMIVLSRIFKKINDNLNKMDSIIQNQFQGRLEVKGGDEIGEIVRRYNQLLDKINSLITELINKEVAGKDAQLKALQYQINPHFIYNTLDVFAGSAETEGNYELADGIAYFGHLLRYNIKGSIYSTIEKELENAKRLVAIYQLKSKGIISLKIECPLYYYNVRIIKYLIQPILENSILHGCSSNFDNLEINISVLELENFIVIRIVDDGCGMSKDDLNKLKNRIFSEEEENNLESLVNTSIGLKNIYHRLKLFYGKTADIKIDSIKNVMTQIEIFLPKECLDDNNKQDEKC